MSKRRVVVTGMGILSPVGNTVDSAWNAVVNGQSGISMIDHFDASAFTTRFAGLVRDFEAGDFFSAKDASKMDEFIQYGIAAGIQAMRDSGLEMTDELADRAGVSMGSGIGGLGMIEKCKHIIDTKGPRRVSPFFVPGSIINMIAGNLSILLGLRGPNLAITTACTSATHNIGMAARLIQYGDADVMLAGGAEKASTPVGLGGFCAARALSKRNDDPQAASRPWDKDRDGFVLGDGAGVLVLEEYEMAKKRGAKIYAEIIGFGMSGDAYHMTLPSGVGAQRSMINAIKDAKLDVNDLQYINAHGTSTKAGDVGESEAVETVMGAAADKVAVSSTKSMTGHALGAAGALEAVFTLKALQEQVAPPTINLDNVDEGCNLNYVPNVAQPMEIEHALSNSFGFGGTNGSLLFKRV
ncbi:3-oxoacyl-[acyl-carrier-protein] synthase 2 [BD1-7 clade bacterium]|uniref:3-oxoacyl-[acyl-carrier-protein] synthase 2 n=1 Tax=BD1-7 clade bacterium TaxID=2029982 RepID=A0A5S9QMH6_9GAMM|nr:3-oxoacyl-[acyl-carrier-protein] synthase 2 [BD1-7 clade bacterium]CAA0116025.1 3-oxoacyl-[acyl-carrier-protein] synthase 2 [BD1-7 clade bacterium]CAA0119689.1 3-oxoacyl-[acyl-carrier-protein] synthase 2 [BD1-7 clade bacterium]